uniref:Uncharacterized protein n=1 Tax=Populus trichocarpa TaxID=3694 RepID=A0A2K1R9B4_POPTR
MSVLSSCPWRIACPTSQQAVASALLSECAGSVASSPALVSGLYLELLASSSPINSLPALIIAFMFFIPLSETEYSTITVSDCLPLCFPS